MTRPIFAPVFNAKGQVQSYNFIGFDYKSEHANRGQPARRRWGRAGRPLNLRRKFGIRVQP